MGKRGPLSPAHRAAISAGLKRYHASRKSTPKPDPSPGVLNITTGKIISQHDAAAIMFGSRAARALVTKKRGKKR